MARIDNRSRGRRRDGGGATGRVVLRDDGRGIPDAGRGDVFAAGYSTSADGTGSGLTVGNRIAEAHEWEVAAAVGTGGGARFEVTGVDPTEVTPVR